MNVLEKELNRLFKGYPDNEETRDLKEEMLGNLEAKITDLTSTGLSYNEALQKSLKTLGNVDHLIDDLSYIYVNKFMLELIQIMLLASLILWIITIPLKVMFARYLLNTVLLFLTIVMAVVYLAFTRKKEQKFTEKVASYPIKSLLNTRKIIWFIWVLFVVVTTLTTLAIEFSSNVWFMRPVSITGPYTFAELIIRYSVPFLTIVFPLLFSKALGLMRKYEVGEKNES